MKTLEILEEVYNKEIIDKNFSRRESLTRGLSFGLKAVLAAIPFGFLNAYSNRAYAAPPPTNSAIVDILNFALTLEYLESTFYTTGLGVSGLIPSSDLTVIMQISKHETAHVALLKTTITSLQGTPVAMPTFDFTAGGTYPDVFSNYQTFLTLSNAFEDTGVRAYKGQAPALLGSGAVLTAALDIHSVEARHASEIRRIRGLKGWISNADANGLPAAIYAGDDNISQLNLNVTTLTTAPAISVTEAFDEPLTMAQVLAIAGPFIK
jgi:hypothetical protein